MTFYAFPDGDVVELAHHVPADAAKISGAEFKRRQVANAKRDLLKILSPGMTVYTIRKGPSAHTVAVPRIREDGRLFIHDITHLVALAAGFRRDKDGAIRQGGGGYSKAFHIVYGLGACLWPNGTDAPHGTRNGEPDTDGGYALKQDTL